jgi:hypothetical protein
MPHIFGESYIETGLSEGTSMAVALAFSAPAFLELHGIEVDAAMVEKSRSRFANEKRLTIHHGSSLDVLPTILDPTRRTVFWLDAHYDGAKPTSFDPRHGQCVLLEELRLIAKVPWKTRPVILIDDASTFCSDAWWDRGAHGHGMDRQQNPTFQQLYDAIGVLDNRYSFFIKDQCIYCYPEG